jgi:hypothetical protein
MGKYVSDSGLLLPAASRSRNLRLCSSVVVVSSRNRYFLRLSRCGGAGDRH